MRKPGFDPGLTQQYTGNVRRIVEKDGRFNVRRRGGNWHDVHPYLHLINMGWPQFLGWLILGYLVTNTIFAAVFYELGPGQLAMSDGMMLGQFLECFFFSAHTLTTVGYGSIAPIGLGANVVASIESLVGVLFFAVATGLLFGRVSRPSAKIGYSENILMAPYQDITSLQCRVVNRRANELMELEARVLLMTVDMVNGQPQRRYQQLKLEREQLTFLPLTWTVVHPIDNESPLWGVTPADFERRQTEILVMIKAYDDTFSHTVFSRYSYRFDEVIWNMRFAPAFTVDDEGELVLDLQKVGQFKENEGPPELAS
uniref:Ion transport 2 domain protein n=1 Tax=Solibacter usitatus (strain Ellin6076) TaxID=234267 RepID=Q01ZW6_SOLUE